MADHHALGSAGRGRDGSGVAATAPGTGTDGGDETGSHLPIGIGLAVLPAYTGRGGKGGAYRLGERHRPGKGAAIDRPSRQRGEGQTARGIVGEGGRDR